MSSVAGQHAPPSGGMSKSTMCKIQTTNKMLELLKMQVTPGQFAQIMTHMEEREFDTIDLKMKELMCLANKIDPNLAASCVAKLKSRCGVPCTKRKRPVVDGCPKDRVKKINNTCSERRLNSLRETVLNAVAYGDLEALRIICSESPCSEELHELRDRDNNTAVHVATKSNQPHVLQFLLENGWYPEVRNSCGRTPLMIAARKGYYKIAQVLIRHGAEVDAFDGHECTSLILAVRYSHTKVVKLLLDNGADINLQGPSKGFTPLMVAAVAGSVELAELLLMNGADRAIQCRDGCTAFLLAAKAGKVDTTGFLNSKATSENDVCLGGYSALHLAARNGHLGVVVKLIQMQFDIEKTNPLDHDRTALMVACELGRVDVAQALLTMGAKLCSRDANGFTAMSLAEMNGHTVTVRALKLTCQERYGVPGKVISCGTVDVEPCESPSSAKTNRMPERGPIAVDPQLLLARNSQKARNTQDTMAKFSQHAMAKNAHQALAATTQGTVNNQQAGAKLEASMPPPKTTSGPRPIAPKWESAQSGGIPVARVYEQSDMDMKPICKISQRLKYVASKFRGKKGSMQMRKLSFSKPSQHANE